jgi:hypothetical protein
MEVPLDRVSAAYLTDAPAPVVEYDEQTGTVAFNLGLSRPSYRIVRDRRADRS